MSSQALFIAYCRRLPLLAKANTSRIACCQMAGLSQTTSGGNNVNDYSEPTIPAYEDKIGEPVHVKRARLQYQSRKRGMLENDLLLSGFASKFLSSMEEPQLTYYDRLINLPSNDWELYYWATGVKDTPAEFQNEVMKQLQQYVRNENKEDRSRMPNLW